MKNGKVEYCNFILLYVKFQMYGNGTMLWNGPSINVYIQMMTLPQWSLITNGAFNTLIWSYSLISDRSISSKDVWRRSLRLHIYRYISMAFSIVYSNCLYRKQIFNSKIPSKYNCVCPWCWWNLLPHTRRRVSGRALIH